MIVIMSKKEGDKLRICSCWRTPVCSAGEFYTSLKLNPAVHSHNQETVDF
jgi:hypothetical protein